MSFDAQIIAISNLAVMVLVLTGFVYYKIETFRRLETRLNKRISQLQDLLTENTSETGDQPLSNSRRQQAHQNLNDLTRQQLEMLDTMLDMEEIDDHLNNRELRQLTLHINTLKSQAMQSQKLIETLKADSRISLHRQTALETKVEEKTRRLEKAIAINNELKEHYQIIITAYKAMVQKFRKLQESKEELEHTIGENNRLTTQMDEFKELHHQQMMEIESLKTANQTQSKALITEELNEFESEFEALQEQLIRTEKERKFLEDQFLDVVNSLDAKETIEDELDRSKKEYTLLEDRFVELSELENQKSES